MATPYKTSHEPELRQMGSPGIFSVPRTVSCLVIVFARSGAVLLMWFSGAWQEDVATGPNYKAGLIAVATTYLSYSALQGPSTPMIRPHPVVWRLVHGVAVLYFLALVFLLFQGKQEARALLKNIDPALGEELPERAYGETCQLWIPGQGINKKVLHETLWDEFVIAHTLGWFAKAVMLRNYWILWTCSIGFEVMEQTFQHWLANFNECWWDSWLLDVLICNWGGMTIGMLAVNFFGSKTYDWQGTAKKKGLLRQGLQQFTPSSFEIFDWAIFSSPKRFLQALVLVAVALVFELNAFFLKTLLWIPPPHFLNIARLVFLWAVGLPGVKEYHEFLQGDSKDVLNKLGSFAWLAAAILAVEVLNIIKLGRDEFTAPFPAHIKIAWAAAFTALVVTVTAWQVQIWVKSYYAKVSLITSPSKVPGSSKKTT